MHLLSYIQSYYPLPNCRDFSVATPPKSRCLQKRTVIQKSLIQIIEAQLKRHTHINQIKEPPRTDQRVGTDRVKCRKSVSSMESAAIVYAETCFRIAARKQCTDTTLNQSETAPNNALYSYKVRVKCVHNIAPLESEPRQGIFTLKYLFN